MPPRQLETKVFTADTAIRGYENVMSPTAAATDTFAGSVTKSELLSLMADPQNEDFHNIISSIAARAEQINATVSTLAEMNLKFSSKVALTRDEIQLGRDIRDDIKVTLKELYTDVSQTVLKLTKSEETLNAQKQELQNKQRFGFDVSSQLAELDQRLKSIDDQKKVLGEFFKAFRGENINYAIKLAEKIRDAQAGLEKRNQVEEARRIEFEKQQGIKTAFESLLNENGIPVRRLQQERRAKIEANPALEADAWNEYYSQLGRFFISLLLDMVEDKQSFQYLDMGGNITQQKFTISGEVTRLGPAEVVEKATLKKIAEDIKLSEFEIEAANKMIGEISTQLYAMAVVLDKDDEYLSIDKETGAVKGKAQTFEGIMQMFPAGGTSLNPWMWENLFKVGRLYWKDDKGNWHEDDDDFGKKTYRAFREILIRGRNVNPNTFEQDIYSPPLGKEDLHKSDVLAARLMDATGEWRQFKVKSRAIPYEKPVVPIKQAIPGKSKDKRMANFYDVVRGLTNKTFVNLEPPRRLPQPPNDPGESDVDYATRIVSAAYRKQGYHLDEHATTLAAKLSDITGETDFQDSTRSKKDLVGKPEGVTLFSQIMNVLRQIRKYTEQQEKGGSDRGDATEQTVGRINEAIVMDRAMWTFLDYFGYDGKTYTQQIIENEDPEKIVWGEVTSEAIKLHGLDPGTLGQGMHPKEAQQLFGTMVSHFLPVVKQMWEANFDLRSLMKINYETGTIEQVNVEKIDALIDSLRKILDYFSYTESSYPPLVVQQPYTPSIDTKTEEERIAEEERVRKEQIRNPTGDMITIAVRSSINPSKEITFTTRIDQIFPMHPMHLWRWLPQELRDESARTRSNQEATYFLETYPDTNHGKRAKETWVIQVPVENLTDLPNPKILLARENVYRFVYALIYPGNQKSMMDVSDWAVLMSVLTDKGYQMMEEGWWEGPIYHTLRKAARKVIGWSEGVVEREFGPQHTKWLKTADQFLDKEIGSFKHRSIYPWEMGWQLIKALNDKLTLDEFGKIQSGLEEFFTAKRGKH